MDAPIDAVTGNAPVAAPTVVVRKRTSKLAALKMDDAGTPGDDRELVSLRLAECDFYLKRWRNARTALRPYIDRASRQGEALFFYAEESDDDLWHDR